MNGYCLRMQNDDEENILFFRDIRNAYSLLRNLLMKDIITNKEYFPHELDYYDDLTIEGLITLVDVKSEHIMFIRSSPNNWFIQYIEYEDEPIKSYFQKFLDKFY